MNVRPCDIPECRICRWNDEQYQDSGHVVDERLGLAEAFIGTAAIVAWFAFFLVLLPVMAS